MALLAMVVVVGARVAVTSLTATFTSTARRRHLHRAPAFNCWQRAFQFSSVTGWKGDKGAGGEIESEKVTRKKNRNNAASVSAS
uniref:Putative secreted protein n=1 Tax=Anopheles triannulatus TaxID=58253 RepID=A0A2M4B7I2_9DIPT